MVVSLHDILRGDIIPLSGILISIGRNTYDPPSPTVPVNDIHFRSAILYDSGAPAQSGIIQFDSARNHLQVITANSGAQPIVTAQFFYAYDGAGGTSITTAKVTQVMATVLSNYDTGAFAYVANQLQINMSGTYLFTWRGTYKNNTLVATPQITVSNWLEQQAPGGSFVEVSGTRSYIFNRASTADANHGTCGATYIVPDIGVGHIFRIRAETTVAASTAVQVSDGSALMVQRVR